MIEIITDFKGLQEDLMRNCPSFSLKFLMAEREALQVIIIGNPETNLTDLMFGLPFTEPKVIGGGNIEVEENNVNRVYWNSFSLQREVGYDKPENKEEAERLINVVREKITEWLKEKSYI